MKGFIRKAAAGLCLSASAVAIVGCTQYRAHVDPCWPERYDYESRQVILNVFDNQAANGHTLDQTIWNWDFEKDDKGNPTDKLTPGGQERLKYLARRRPAPDGRIYLQTANDLPAEVAIEQYPVKRQELDTQRVAAVQKYMGAIMAGRSTPVTWDVAVHDPAPAYLPATVVGGAPVGFSTTVTGAYPKLTTNFQGVFGTVSGFTTPVGGGGGGGAGAGGGGGASQGGNQQGTGAGSPQPGAGTPPNQ